MDYDHRSLRKLNSYPDIESGHNMTSLRHIVQLMNKCMTPDMLRGKLSGSVIIESQVHMYIHVQYQDTGGIFGLLTCISTNIAARRNVSPCKYALAVDFRPWSN